MVSPERRKGADWEREIVKFLRERAGLPFVERCFGAGRPNDVGDVDGVAGWCIEAKAQDRLAIPGWVKEAEKEAKNARARWWCVIAKRKNKPTAEAYVVMPLAAFAELLAEDVEAVA